MQLKRIAFVPDLGVAMVLQSLLENHGCVVVDAGAGSLSRSGANIGGFMIVPDDDAQQAKDILQAHGFAEYII